MVVKMEDKNLVFTYVPKGWSDDLFRRFGGYVAVVLNYNKSGMIEKAARSAIGQDFPCYEVIMMDDCSRDGSEQEMLSVAKEYALNGGKCKVSVVFNEHNKTILGQWKQAVRLSPQGNWFVMFCGDDVSHPNRLSVLNENAIKCPDAWGVCTYFNPSNRAKYTCKKGVQVWRGKELNFPIPHFYGCAAMWCREVLTVDLPAYNLDDFFLFWTVIIRRQQINSIALVWDLEHSCVEYSVGTGITTEIGRQERLSSGSWWSKCWREAEVVHRNNLRFGTSFWSLVVSFDGRYGCPGKVRDIISAHYRLAMMDEVNWFHRLWIYLNTYIGVGIRATMVDRCIRRRFYERVVGNSGYCLCALIGIVKNNIRRRNEY